MKRFLLWVAALLLSLSAAAQSADTVLRYVVSRNKLEVKDGNRPVEISDQWLKNNVLPGFGAKSLRDYWVRVQEEFEVQCVRKFPALGVGMPPHFDPRVYVEFVIDSSNRITDLRLLAAGEKEIGDVAVAVIAGTSGLTCARELVCTGQKAEWQKVPARIWVIFDTKNLWKRGREAKK